MINFLYNYGLVDLDNFDEDDIDTVSVAKALSRLRRWCGNFDSMSVAQHCMCVSEVVKMMGGTPQQQMAALHHDDAECFIGDVPSNVKAVCDAYKDIEAMVNQGIEDKYGIDLDDPMVRQADAICGARELYYHLDREPLMPRLMIELPTGYSDYRISQTALTPWPESTTLSRYLDKHDELMMDMLESIRDERVLEADPSEGEEDPCLN